MFSASLQRLAIILLMLSTAMVAEHDPSHVAVVVPPAADDAAQCADMYRQYVDAGCCDGCCASVVSASVSASSTTQDLYPSAFVVLNERLRRAFASGPRKLTNSTCIFFNASTVLYGPSNETIVAAQRVASNLSWPECLGPYIDRQALNVDCSTDVCHNLKTSFQYYLTAADGAAAPSLAAHATHLHAAGVDTASCRQPPPGDALYPYHYSLNHRQGDPDTYPHLRPNLLTSLRKDNGWSVMDLIVKQKIIITMTPTPDNATLVLVSVNATTSLDGFGSILAVDSKLNGDPSGGCCYVTQVLDTLVLLTCNAAYSKHDMQRLYEQTTVYADCDCASMDAALHCKTCPKVDRYNFSLGTGYDPLEYIQVLDGRADKYTMEVNITLGSTYRDNYDTCMDGCKTNPTCMGAVYRLRPSSTFYRERTCYRFLSSASLPDPKISLKYWDGQDSSLPATFVEGYVRKQNNTIFAVSAATPTPAPTPTPKPTPKAPTPYRPFYPTTLPGFENLCDNATTYWRLEHTEGAAVHHVTVSGDGILMDGTPLPSNYSYITGPSFVEECNDLCGDHGDWKCQGWMWNQSSMVCALFRTSPLQFEAYWTCEASTSEGLLAGNVNKTSTLFKVEPMGSSPTYRM